MLLSSGSGLIVIGTDISIEVLIHSSTIQTLTDWLLLSWLKIFGREHIDGGWNLLWLLVENVAREGWLIVLRNSSTKLNGVVNAHLLFLSQVNIHVYLWLWVLFLWESYLLSVSVISISSSNFGTIRFGYSWCRLHNSIGMSWGIRTHRGLFLVVLHALIENTRGVLARLSGRLNPLNFLNC